MKLRAVLGAVLVASVSPATAAEWSFDPRLAAAYLYNDNNRLTDVPGAEIDVSGAELNAEIAIRAETPRSLFQLTPRLRSTFFPDDEQEEADDRFVKMLARHATERAVALLDVNYSSVVTLGDYYPGSAVKNDDTLGDPDRGVSVGQSGRNRQDRLVFTPQFSFDVTERQRLELDIEYLDVTYDEQVQGDREDFQDLAFAVGYRFALSETASVAVRGGFATFDPADADSTDAQGLNVEWRNEISDTAEAYVRVGANRVETIANNGGSNWDTGFAGGAGMRWAFEVTDIWLDAESYLDPNSTGVIVNRNQARAQLSRRLGPLTRVMLGARVISDTGTGDAQDSFTDRVYAAGNLGIEWRIARKWTLVGSYDYSWREYDNAVTDAASNSFRIGVVWEPNRR